MENIKAIVFDLGGVIFSSDGISYESREKLAEEFGLNKEELHKKWFNKKDLLITGKIPEEEFLREMTKIQNMPLTVEQLRERIRGENKINKDMIYLLKKLKNHYKLVALNNEIKESNEYRIKKFRLNKYFDEIITSCDVGFAKPNLRIYEILLQKLKINPNELIFIDNRVENLAPAEKLGIKSHLFENKKKLIDWFNKLGVSYIK